MVPRVYRVRGVSRDKLIANALALRPRNGVRDYYQPYARLLQAAYRDGKLDDDALSKMDEGIYSGLYPDIHYLAACYHDEAGDKQTAIAHYRLAASSPHDIRQTVNLSWHRLRELGENPAELRINYTGFQAHKRPFSF